MTVEGIAVFFGIVFSFCFALFVMAWVTILPCIGLLHLMGLMK